jgi:hypothetical protein
MAAMLAIIGGVNSAISGYLVARNTWAGLFPAFGFVGFVLGVLMILGGIFINRGRIVLGGNLAICCGAAGLLGFSQMALLQAFVLLFGEAGFLVGYILTIAISVGFPVLGGILALISRGTKDEAN